MTDLVAALAKAQSKMSNAALNKINPHFNSRYADLASIRNAVIPCLAAEGIALIQAIESSEHGTTVVTRLLKGSEEINSTCPVIWGGVKPQDFGSALTYARRYSMASICGISADEDDDANAAQASAVEVQKVQRKRPEVKTIKVPEIGGESDWMIFATSLMAELEAAQTVDTVNELIRSHAAPLAKLRKDDPAILKGIETKTKTRRTELEAA